MEFRFQTQSPCGGKEQNTSVLSQGLLFAENFGLLPQHTRFRTQEVFDAKFLGMFLRSTCATSFCQSWQPQPPSSASSHPWDSAFCQALVTLKAHRLGQIQRQKTGLPSPVSARYLLLQNSHSAQRPWRLIGLSYYMLVHQFWKFGVTE